MDLQKRRNELMQKLNEAVLVAEQLKGAIAILDEQLAAETAVPANRAARRREARTAK